MTTSTSGKQRTTHQRTALRSIPAAVGGFLVACVAVSPDTASWSELTKLKAAGAAVLLAVGLWAAVAAVTRGMGPRQPPKAERSNWRTRNTGR
jgi:hypothetical protein